MVGNKVEYKPLFEEGLSDDRSFSPCSKCQKQLRSWSCAPACAWCLFTLSLVLNTCLCIALNNANPSNPSPSRFAGLSWTNTSHWTDGSAYFNRSSRFKSDEAWNALDFSPGIVAISDQEAGEMHLPTSQRFPWDDSKGIYLINSYHNLHCLKWLWGSLSKFRDGGRFEMIDWHGFHCLDQLRQDVICYADDTPRYTGAGQGNQSSGFRQGRRCRDWGRLERWARERTGCYRFLGNEVYDTLDRHKFCPEGSGYNARIEEAFGKGERARLVDLYGEVAA